MMGADQQFCLRWNNFHTNITSAFESLRDDEDFVDITLACEGRQVKAHKMVLSACSPYFKSLLRGNPCQHPIVFLKDVSYANLLSLMAFMYQGEVNVSHDQLATFLKTAESLKVRGLAEDGKKKDSESCNESGSPPPPRDPPDPGSPRPEESNTADTHLSDSPPPAKRQRRRSGASVQSAEDTNETVLSEVRECTSVKNEPQEFNEEDEIISHSLETTDNIKTDLHEENSEERSFGPSDSVTISRSQAAMQQLQESFGSFMPSMGQSQGFLSQGASDMNRPPPFSMEGVQESFDECEKKPCPLSVCTTTIDSDQIDKTCITSTPAVRKFNLTSRPTSQLTIEEHRMQNDEITLMTVQRTLKKILLRQNYILDEIHQIKEHLQPSNNSSLPGNDVITPVGDLQSLDEIVELPSLIETLKSCKSLSVNETSRRMIRKVMSRDLALQFSYSGLGRNRAREKMALKDHKLMPILLDALNQVGFSSDKENILAIQRVLRSARDWDGSRPHRRASLFN